MSKSTEKRLIVGLDIGTSKVVAIVGEVGADDTVDIIGIGSHPSRGMKKGVVVNIESTVASIQRAVEEAELMAGCQIHSVYTGIAGSHIKSLNSHGIVAIKDNEVAQSDVERVIDAAKAVAIPADQKIMHVLPQEFVIDNQEGSRLVCQAFVLKQKYIWLLVRSVPRKTLPNVWRVADLKRKM